MARWRNLLGEWPAHLAHHGATDAWFLTVQGERQAQQPECPNPESVAQSLESLEVQLWLQPF